MKKVFLSLTFCFLVFGAEAAVAIGVDNCSDLAELNQKWKTKYYYVLNNPEIQLVNLSCNDSNYKIAKALDLLENHGVSNFFDMLNYFKTFVRHVFIDFSVNKVAEIDYQFNGDFYLYGQYFKDDDTYDYKRASVLIHEARHLQVGEKSLHVVCTGGGRKGYRNCDQEFNDDWSQASPISYEILFLSNLLHSSRVNLNSRTIKDWINFYLDNGFNHVSPELRNNYYSR